MEGELRRKKGRPRKDVSNINTRCEMTIKKTRESEDINDTSFNNLNLDEEVRANAIFLNLISDETESGMNKTSDAIYHALLSSINSDPINYQDTTDTNRWERTLVISNRWGAEINGG